MTCACPVCGSQAVQSVAEFSNSFFANSATKMNVTISYCDDCQFCFQASAYKDIYDKIALDVYNDYHVNSIFPFPERSRKNITALELLNNNISLKENASILEIGSNRGDLLFLIKEAYPKVNVLGVEPTMFTDDLQIPTICENFRASLFSNKFDIIIIKHVLEHIKYPLLFLRELKALLKDDGHLYIEVPDLQTSLENCLDDFIPDHVSYFDEYSLSTIVNKAGLSVEMLQKNNFLHLIASNQENQNYDLLRNNLKMIDIVQSNFELLRLNMTICLFL